MTFQEAIALQKATGNQNVITPENYGRIMGLSAQAEAGKQLAMDRGAQAVEERKRLQALQGDGSLASQGRLLETYDPEKGRQRFVFDKQGNVIGSATLDNPAAPVAGIDRGLMNAGLATDQEKQLLRQAMRDKMLAAVQGDKGMKAYDELQAEKAAAAQAQAESTGLKALTGGFSSIPFRQFQGSNFLDYIRDQSGAADALAKAEAAAAQSEAEATGLKALTGVFSPVPFRQPQQGKDFLDYIRNQAKDQAERDIAAEAALAQADADALAQSDAEAKAIPVPAPSTPASPKMEELFPLSSFQKPKPEPTTLGELASISRLEGAKAKSEKNLQSLKEKTLKKTEQLKAEFEKMRKQGASTEKLSELANQYAEAKAESVILSGDSEEAKRMKAKDDYYPSGILPSIGAFLEAGRLGLLDFGREARNAYSNVFLGGERRPLSRERDIYNLKQRYLRELGF